MSAAGSVLQFWNGTLLGARSIHLYLHFDAQSQSARSEDHESGCSLAHRGVEYLHPHSIILCHFIIAQIRRSDYCKSKQNFQIDAYLPYHLCWISLQHVAVIVSFRGIIVLSIIYHTVHQCTGTGSHATSKTEFK